MDNESTNDKENHLSSKEVNEKRELKSNTLK
jgi:hypothetical protein